MDLLKVLAVVGSVALLVVVVELIRRGRLKERYSLLWLLAGGLLLFLSLSRGILDSLAGLFGIFYPPSLLFLLAFLFLLLITLHYSVVLSGLSEKNRHLAQEVALLRREVEEALKRDTKKREAKG
ncbi:MAG TPA: DUF2304 domain-containing protein [Nitrospirota bacterium]|nr:DUF2304 domain-containing protein [Nitrospirota bacterium]